MSYTITNGFISFVKFALPYCRGKRGIFLEIYSLGFQKPKFWGEIPLQNGGKYYYILLADETVELQKGMFLQNLKKIGQQ